MIGHSSVTLSDGDTNEITLNLSRKVILLRSVIIKDVPAGTTDVSVKISPIQESILLNGTYQGDEGAFSVALTKQSDGTTWKMATEDVYLLPSVGKPTITITIGSTPFTYTCPNELEANHKITINGTYKEPTTQPAELTLTGTINGVAWGEDSQVSFDFGPTDKPSTPSGDIPAEGSTYLGCYVLKVNGNEVTLLSPSQKNGIVYDEDENDQATISSKINAELANWEKNISSNWRLMNYEEANYIRASYSSISESLSVKLIKTNYFYSNNNTIYHFTPGQAQLFPNQQGGKYDTYLRPVTTITIQ